MNGGSTSRYPCSRVWTSSMKLMSARSSSAPAPFDRQNRPPAILAARSKSRISSAPPRPRDGIVLFPGAVGDRGIRHIRHREEELLHPPLDLREFPFGLLEPDRERLHPLHELRRVLLLPPEPADLLRSGVALRPHPLHLDEQRTAGLVPRHHTPHGES